MRTKTVRVQTKTKNLVCTRITFAPHRPQQKENQTNIGGSIEKCGAIGIGNEKPKKEFTTKPKAEHMHSKPSHVACGGQLRFTRETDDDVREILAVGAPLISPRSLLWVLSEVSEVWET